MVTINYLKEVEKKFEEITIEEIKELSNSFIAEIIVDQEEKVKKIIKLSSKLLFSFVNTYDIKEFLQYIGKNNLLVKSIDNLEELSNHKEFLFKFLRRVNNNMNSLLDGKKKGQDIVLYRSEEEINRILELARQEKLKDVIDIIVKRDKEFNIKAIGNLILFSCEEFKKVLKNQFPITLTPQQKNDFLVFIDLLAELNLFFLDGEAAEQIKNILKTNNFDIRSFNLSNFENKINNLLEKKQIPSIIEDDKLINYHINKNQSNSKEPLNVFISEAAHGTKTKIKETIKKVESISSKNSEPKKNYSVAIFLTVLIFSASLLAIWLTLKKKQKK